MTCVTIICVLSLWIIFYTSVFITSSDHKAKDRNWICLDIFSTIYLDKFLYFENTGHAVNNTTLDDQMSISCQIYASG